MSSNDTLDIVFYPLAEEHVVPWDAVVNAVEVIRAVVQEAVTSLNLTGFYEAERLKLALDASPMPGSIRMRYRFSFTRQQRPIELQQRPSRGKPLPNFTPAEKVSIGLAVISLMAADWGVAAKNTQSAVNAAMTAIGIVSDRRGESMMKLPVNLTGLELVGAAVRDAQCSVITISYRDLSVSFNGATGDGSGIGDPSVATD